jgi:flagellar motor switch protein FliN/FliY
MSLISDLATTNEVAMAVAGAVERALGNEVILAVGLPREEPPNADALPPGELRAVQAPFTGAIGGACTLLLAAGLAARLEAAAADQQLVTVTAEAVAAGAAEVVRGAGDAAAGDPVEVDAQSAVTRMTTGEFLVYPLLEGSERVACLVVHVGAPAEPGAADDGPSTTPVALHEFQPLGLGAGGNGDSRPLTLLADVEMGVTAELGRRRMTVRELLSLTPGTVIELDRAAGSPVDVLVNGTLIARGEVVVVDEEFGIRISEIVATTDAGAR